LADSLKACSKPRAFNCWSRKEEETYKSLG